MEIKKYAFGYKNGFFCSESLRTVQYNGTIEKIELIELIVKMFYIQQANMAHHQKWSWIL